MERDILFVQTVDWLGTVGRQQPPIEHELLLASGRLRLLLLDSQRLVDQVNMSRRLDLRYRILRHGDGPPFEESLLFWAVPDGLSPDLVATFAPDHTVPVESVKLDAFLRERVIIYKGEDVTVRDLIDHLANVVGGVHAGKARTARELKLDELAQEVVIQGMDAGIRCLRSIVVVVVEALRPLRDSIVAGG